MKTTLSLIFALIFTVSTAQIGVGVYQDARLAFFGDGEQYDAGTVNFLARFKMCGFQQKYGYMIVFPEFEYADIKGQYKRYSANLGYTFNQLLVNNVEASISGGFGWIDRYGKTVTSLSGQGELAYVINNIRLSLVGQLTQRNDMKWLYGKSEVVFSGFFGLEYRFNL